jgi:hypothetical protein
MTSSLIIALCLSIDYCHFIYYQLFASWFPQQLTRATFIINFSITPNTEFNLPIVTYTGARVGCHYWEVSLTRGKCAAFLLDVPPVPEHSRKSALPSYWTLHQSQNILEVCCLAARLPSFAILYCSRRSMLAILLHSSLENIVFLKINASLMTVQKAINA